MKANADRLYDLLPSVYRLRDAEQGYPLKALLRVIGEQVDVVEEDIQRLYDNWFIETCDDWMVPYIADLVGYRLVHEAGEPGSVETAEGLARNKILVPRREVANTLRNRRRKGTLSLLEELARDVAGWPARAVEFFKLLGWTQNINHLHLEDGRARLVDLRHGDALDLLDSPFDRLAHTVDVRRINSQHEPPGRYNIPSVGLFVWRLNTYPVTQTPANCLEQVAPYCYSFSVLGQDGPLFAKPEPELEPTHIAAEANLPVPIRRRALEKHKELYYGEDKSLAVWASDWAGYDLAQPIPAHAVIAADLTDWQKYQPPPDHIAVDPVLGRIVFPENQLPKRVRVSYRYGFSTDLGGGEYDRQLFQPRSVVFYRVGRDEALHRLSEAIARWKHDGPKDAVIEITDSGIYAEPIDIDLHEGQSLQIRAANRKRPVIRLLDWQTDLPDALGVSLAPGADFTLDGLTVTGRSVRIRGGKSMEAIPKDCEHAAPEVCPARVRIRHCTLVPGWGLAHDCEPRRPAEPSLELVDTRARVHIDHSIIGSIQISENEVMADPIPFLIEDSILDATGSKREALGAPGRPVAHALLTMRRCTVFGIVQVHAIELAENCIFNDCLNVARRQLGCMRFCYVPPICRTPRRYHCQPDLAEKNIEEAMQRAAKEMKPPPNSDVLKDEISKAKLLERERVRPQFNSVRYGTPTYCQLAGSCAEEIKRGADDESEMGVFHDLFQPQREANLRARLEEHTPAGIQAGIIFAS